MSTLPKKHSKSFYAAQEKVRQLFEPYLPRCVGQYFTKRDAIEQFVLCSKEEDAGPGRHKWRGILTVNYQFPMHKDDNCGVQFSYSEDLIAHALKVPMNPGWQASQPLLEMLIPPLETETA